VLVQVARPCLLRAVLTALSVSRELEILDLSAMVQGNRLPSPSFDVLSKNKSYRALSRGVCLALVVIAVVFLVDFRTHTHHPSLFQGSVEDPWPNMSHVQYRKVS
jgi:hypothetical protein